MHLHICEPIDFEGDVVEELSIKIEKDILTNYKIWPTSHIAAKALSFTDPTFNYFDESQIDSDQENKFLKRFNGIEERVRNECLETYVRPMFNKKKVRGEL